MIAGRGAFIECFLLFGYDVQGYETLFTEHLNVLINLNQKERITWSGQIRPLLTLLELLVTEAEWRVIQSHAAILALFVGSPAADVAIEFELLAIEVAPLVRKVTSK
jgi:hypothetical protein